MAHLARVALVTSLLLCGCGSALPAPRHTRHPLAAFSAVPYPPPAALAETVPPRPPRARAVWIDGEWVYEGQSYVWRRGGWVVPPPASRFAPWRAWYRDDGRLMLAPGTWYDADGRALGHLAPRVPAYTPPNRITPEGQTGR